MKINLKKNNILIFSIIFFLAILLRIYYFLNLDSWFDEWNMMYTVNPFITNEETWERFFGDRGDHYLPEYYPPLNAFILKYFLLYTGYYAENARIYSLLFGCSSVLLVYILSTLITKSKTNYIATFLFSINLFVIWQSNEIRPHSFVLFFSLLNIILFINLIRKPLNIFFSTLYICLSVLLLSSWPFALTIYFGKSLYILIHYNLKKISLYKYFFIFLSILVFYIFFNYDYLIYHLQRDSHYTILNLSFFYSFHFRSFFGSVFMGGVFLILFSFFLLKDLKKNLRDENESNILIYIIISSYFLTISYSILKAGVISPKYIIFVLPLIIVWVSYKINLTKLKSKIIILLVILNILNTFYFFFKNPIDRPPFNKVIKIISESKVLNVVTNEDLVTNNAFNNYKNFDKKKLILFDLQSENFIDANHQFIDSKSDNLLVNEFWFVCLNNPRFAVGSSKMPTKEKCKIFENSKNYTEIKNIKIDDFILKRYERNG